MCRPYDAACRACSSNANITNATACGACVAVVRYMGRNPYLCHECAGYGVLDSDIQHMCQSECVPQTLTRGRFCSGCIPPTQTQTQIDTNGECGQKMFMSDLFVSVCVYVSPLKSPNPPIHSPPPAPCCP
ncbi:hypothetical protein Vretifemale_4711 [Volvox reticuliferus]|nr:hypothetical protein Vretifemale_4711 [Volvox reticuliferus]